MSVAKTHAIGLYVLQRHSWRLPREDALPQGFVSSGRVAAFRRILAVVQDSETATKQLEEEDSQATLEAQSAPAAVLQGYVDLKNKLLWNTVLSSSFLAMYLSATVAVKVDVGDLGKCVISLCARQDWHLDLEVLEVAFTCCC